ncbi:MAG: hypothetical protein R3C69_03740 [Geminicoccaceae bacterium]
MRTVMHHMAVLLKLASRAMQPPGITRTASDPAVVAGAMVVALSTSASRRGDQSVPDFMGPPVISGRAFFWLQACWPHPASA